MKLHDNCVVFDDEMALLYDDTRPFLSNGVTSLVLRSLSEYVIDQFRDEEQIEVLDLGTGTGRVAERFVEAYSAVWVEQTEEEKNAPKMVFVGVDISPEMLGVFKEKLGARVFPGVRVRREAVDIRELHRSGLKPHVVLTHWIFHVVSDWRVAVLAVDQAIRKNGILVRFGEESELYDAIDGNFKDIENPHVRTIWQQFFSAREGLLRDGEVRGPGFSPRRRLGSLVVDSRVDLLLGALGWANEPIPDAPEPLSDTWEAAFTLKHLIERVIRARAFTNMRLFPESLPAERVFGELADTLNGDFQGPLLDHPWRFRVHLTCSVFRRRMKRLFPGGRLLLDLAHETVGRRWRRRLDTSFNKETLWYRLFDITWERLHGNGKGAFLRSVKLDRKRDVLGVVACVPFENMGGLTFVAVRQGGVDFPEGGGQELWASLVGSLETHDPFLVYFQRHPGQFLPKHPGGKTSEILPHFHLLKIPFQAVKALCEPSEDPPTQEYFVQLTEALRRSEALSSVLKEARSLGLISYYGPSQELRFVQALAALANMDEVRGAYCIPTPFPAADCEENTPTSSGIMVLSDRILPRSTAGFFWSFADIIFGEYLEEIHLGEEPVAVEAAETPDLTQGVDDPEEPSQEPVVRTVLIEKRDPEPFDEEDGSPPAVLIITSPVVERKALLEAAGIPLSEEGARTRLVGNHPFLDLGTPGFPAWTLQIQPGSTEPGSAGAALTAAVGALVPRPRWLIAAGIAFGLQPDQQELGDLLVSIRVHNYEPKREGEISIPRGSTNSASPEILSLFRSFELGWTDSQERSGDSSPPEIHWGTILSGEKLVDHPDLVARLKSEREDALGGEMEGVGIVATALEYGPKWIIVKVIADWGIKKNGTKYQKDAATNAMSFVMHVLTQPSLVSLSR